MSRELTDEQMLDLISEAKGIGGAIRTDAQLFVFARAAIKADRALRVPMTDVQIDAAAEGWSWWIADTDDFKAGIHAAEKFHGIRPKEQIND